MDANDKKSNKLPLIIGAILIMLVLVGTGTFVLSQNRDNPNTSKSDTNKENINTNTTITNTPINSQNPNVSSKYIEFSPSVVSENADKK